MIRATNSPPSALAIRKSSLTTLRQHRQSTENAVGRFSAAGRLFSAPNPYTFSFEAKAGSPVLPVGSVTERPAPPRERESEVLHKSSERIDPGWQVCKLIAFVVKITGQR
jgi:hypothetical protein